MVVILILASLVVIFVLLPKKSDKPSESQPQTETTAADASNLNDEEIVSEDKQ